MINVALLSRWHVHADDYAKDARNHPQLDIKLVWDEDEERGRKWAEELGVPFEADLDSVLSNQGIDAVIVNTPTNLHKEVMIKAANNKKHIFSEKVMAFTVKDCVEIFDAIEKNGVHFMLSLPRLTAGYYLYAQQMLDEGKLGKLTTIRCRLAHNGAVSKDDEYTGWLPERFFNKEEAGGGALMDLGAHPIYLTNRLAGEAVSIQAKLQETFGHGVDDNAVVIVEYDSGALGIIEAGFVSGGSPFQLELYGTEGSVMIEDETIRVNSQQLETTGWHSPENIQSIPMPMEQWVDSILNQVEPTITKEDAIQLTLVNEVAAISHQEGKRMTVKEVIQN